MINTWLVALVEAAAEAVALADGLAVDEKLLLEQDFTPGFPLRHALKDARLAASAARLANVDLPLTTAIVARWAELAAQGHGDDDVASVVAGLTHRPPHEPSGDGHVAAARIPRAS